MLKGFTVPLTPTGQSSLVTAPPWYYSSDCMAVEYWGDPAAMAEFLPDGVELDAASNGRAMFCFLDWQFTGSNDELTDPARYQYREAFLLIEARFEGMAINYCPFIFVDNDSAIARGWIQGFPKRLASVFQTRTFAAPGPAAAPLAPGSRFGASISAHGERLGTARVQLEAPIADPREVFNRPTVMRRYFPQLAGAPNAKPPVNELVLSVTDDASIVQLWAGSAELSIPEVAGEEMHRLAPLRVGRGFRFGMAYTVTDLKILRDYNA